MVYPSSFALVPLYFTKNFKAILMIIRIDYVLNYFPIANLMALNFDHHRHQYYCYYYYYHHHPPRRYNLNFLFLKSFWFNLIKSIDFILKMIFL